MTVEKYLVLNILKKVISPVVLLIASTICIQLHAYEYWEATMGNGLLYSLTIEAVAIAFWIYSRLLSNNFPIISIACVATMLSFTAPALNNLAPVLDEYKTTKQKIEIWESQKNRLVEDVVTLKNNWEVNLENSKTRVGWRDATISAQKAYHAKSTELDNHLVSRPSILDILMNNIKIFTILISIAVLQFASVFLSRIIGDGVKSISNRGKKGDDKSDFDDVVPDISEKSASGLHLAYSSKNSQLSSIPENLDLTTHISRELRRKQQEDQELTSAKIAEIAGVYPRDISLLINHEDKLKQKKINKQVRIVAESKAVTIAEHCGIDISPFKSRSLISAH